MPESHCRIFQPKKQKTEGIGVTTEVKYSLLKSLNVTHNLLILVYV